MWHLKQTVSFHKVLIRTATLTRRHRQVNTESSLTSGGGEIENDEFRNVRKPEITAEEVMLFHSNGASKQLTALEAYKVGKEVLGLPSEVKHKEFLQIPTEVNLSEDFALP